MKTLLDRLAGEAPVARLSSHELWRAGRVRRRRRKWQKAALSLLALALAAPVLARPGTTEPPAGSQPLDSVAVPKTIATPYFWQRSFAEAPNGPAKAMFRTPNGVVVLGHGGSYRLLGGLMDGLLSPGGEYAAGVENKLLDLRTGQETDLPPHSRVLAWSGDGSFFVFVSPDGLASYEVATGEIKDIVNNPLEVVAAAVSPDGTRLAFVSRPFGSAGGTLEIFDLSGGSLIAGLELEAGLHLSGPASWSPDGRSVLLVDQQSPPAGNAWRLRSFDVDSRHLTEAIPAQQPDGWVQQVAGWRDGRPVLTYLTDNEIVEARHYEADGSFTTLTSVEAYWLAIPVDVVAQGRFGGAPARAPLFEPDRWVLYLMAVAVVIASGLTLLIARRRRRHRRQAAPGIPTGQDMPLGPIPQ